MTEAGGISRRRSIDRRTAGRLAGAAALVVILGAILGPSVLTTHPSASPGATQVAARPSASHGPSETTGPTSSPEPWEDLAVPPFEAVAAFEPNDTDRLGVATASSFTLRSLTETPAVDLARGLHIDPPLAFKIKPGPTADVAIVTPSADLQAGLRYRVRLDAPDGALAGSWTFTTRAPLHIVATIPIDKSTRVPTNTGIEVEFDQDGAGGVAEHFSIKPSVAGRFEQHGRSWAFVPNQRLVEATIYTVTVTPGVTVEGSTETLEKGTSFRFETDVEHPGTAQVGFDRTLFETRPGERPVLPLGESFEDEEGESPGSTAPTSVTVNVHKLPTFQAALDAAIALAGPDAWAVYSRTAIVDTSGLTLVARVDGTVLRSDAGLFLRLPFQPAAGNYILTIVQDGPPAQLLLQVTDVSAYALTGEKDTVVWVNDLGADSAVAGATVAIAGGAALGATDSAGVLRVATPEALKARPPVDYEENPAPSFLTIRTADGRGLVVPVGLRVAWYAGSYEGAYYGDYSDDSANWWVLLRTDRDAYRQTDTINVYGMIRARSDRSVPGRLELRLRPQDGPIELAIDRVSVTATDRGVFTASVHFEDLPKGSYLVDLYAGSKRVSSTWVNVMEIRKPAYSIEVETDRHVYVLGQRVAISAAASFYDGTPLPGIELRVSAYDDSTRVTTNALGEASGTLKFASDYDPEGWYGDYIAVVPSHPEEGAIEGHADVVLLPSRVWVSGSGLVETGRIIVDGALTWADIKGMEATLDEGGFLDYQEDGPGRPIDSGTIRAKVIHLVPVRRDEGTTYDFIEKKVVHVYSYDTERVSLGTSTLTSRSDGSFHLSLAAPVATDDYEVILTSTDPEGRTFQRTVYVTTPYHASATRAPYLENQGYCGYRPDLPADLDKPVSVTMHDGTGAVAGAGRFLFLVSERGSIETTVQDVATFSRTLSDADLPGFTIRAVWLSDTGYHVSDAAAVVDPDDKRITIKLVPDKERYRPGGHASIAITTTGPNGDPVAADVVVQGIDEKLFTLGLAYDWDPAAQLMSGTGAGFLQSYTSHSLPAYDPGGCGAAGGGGRDDFRDTVTFQRVSTGHDGRGSVEFDLSDDLTSWHMTATAFDRALDSGTASVQLPVGLPFFVDAVLAPEYLVGEQPVLRVRAFGGALSADVPVRFMVEAPSLGLNATPARGTAFDPVRVPLPDLVPGDHRVRIEAEATVGGKTYRDSVIRTIHVVGTRLSGLVASYDALESGFTPQGGPGLTTYTISDEGRGRLIGLLQDLAWDQSGRFDKLAAAELARSILIGEFGVSPNGLPATGFDASRYQRGGVSLLSYSSADLFLSARAALVAPDLLGAIDLENALREWADEAGATRERRIAALAGLAALGNDVVNDLRAYPASSLTVRERLWLALGLAAGGDEDAARAIERDLLESGGQRLGPWVRLPAGTTLDDTLEASGLLLLLAGRLGDPLAHDISNYLRSVRSNQLVFPLEQIGYVRGFLDRLPREPGRFAWTVAGERHEVELRPGGGYTLVLTSKQRATLTLERLKGDLGVVTSWTSPDVELPKSSSISITRTITPATDAPDDKLVHVRIVVTFGVQSAPGCYRLTDLTPSGLSPVAGTFAWQDEEEPDPSSTTNWPYLVEGQEVEWCAAPGDRSHEYTYSARVVSPGTYRWEPAILQFELDPTIGASTPAGTFTIR